MVASPTFLTSEYEITFPFPTICLPVLFGFWIAGRGTEWHLYAQYPEIQVRVLCMRSQRYTEADTGSVVTVLIQLVTMFLAVLPAPGRPIPRLASVSLPVKITNSYISCT